MKRLFKSRPTEKNYGSHAGYSKNHKKSNDPKNDENKTVSAVALESHDQDYKTELRLKKVECQNLREKIKHLEENALARTNIIDVRRNH